MDGRGVRLPPWAVEWASKILPWAFMAACGAGFTLYTNNIGDQRDIANNTRRNDQQDVRMDRLEARIERNENAVSGIQDNNSDFQGKVITRLDKMVEKERRK